MTFYRLTFYPDGHLDGERLDSDEVDPGLAAGFGPPFDAGLVFDTTVPAGDGEARVKWTGSDLNAGGSEFLTQSLEVAHSGMMVVNG